MYEKKKWIKDRMQMRKEIRQLQIDISSLLLKNKHISNVIEKVGTEEEVRISQLF